MILLAILAPAVAPYDPERIDGDARLAAPSMDHWLGTDDLGRDIFTLLLYGARTSFYVAGLAMAVGMLLGIILGLTSGYFGGVLDILLQRVLDVLISFPTIVLALAIVAARGPSIYNVIIALAVVLTPGAARVARSSALSIRVLPYVEAARVIGAGSPHILLRHVFPNAVPPLLIVATSALAGAIIAEAGLSFLGVGTPPTVVSWGTLLSGAARRYIERAPWMALSAGGTVALAMLAINFVGDALRDVVDPRLRNS
jgi:peptide/nickel transport system permease protein